MSHTRTMCVLIYACKIRSFAQISFDVCSSSICGWREKNYVCAILVGSTLLVVTVLSLWSCSTCRNRRIGRILLGRYSSKLKSGCSLPRFHWRVLRWVTTFDETFVSYLFLWIVSVFQNCRVVLVSKQVRCAPFICPSVLVRHSSVWVTDVTTNGSLLEIISRGRNECNILRRARI